MASSSYGSSAIETNQTVGIEKLNIEIRRIESYKLTKLSAIIDSTKAWVRLLEELTRPIVRNPNNNNPKPALNLTLVAINKIEQQISCGESPTLALLNHWAITGRRRPTVGCLLFYLHNCNLKWAEDFVCKSILGIESIDQLILRSPTQAHQLPTPTLNSPSSKFEIEDKYKFDDLFELVKELNVNNIARYSFEEIYNSTNRFCHKPFHRINQIGSKIGEGRFSSVYRAKTSQFNQNNTQLIAAKLLKSDCNKKYLVNEINLIREIKHENILQLLGLAFGGDNNLNEQEDDKNFKYICLIYPYMQNGSLLDCLSYGLPTKNMQFINCIERLNILVKIARGISYLHSLPTGPIIHRDIKTANILIDDNIQPKVGDFTLVRQVETLRATETQFSQNIIGTSVYMPPEAFRGDISIKFDTFSYGIVLLELLTGMRPFNEEEDEDLFTYINEKLSDIEDDFINKQANDNSATSIEELKNKFLISILDKKAGDWNFEICKSLFDISLKATESRKKDRPEMTSILPLLERIVKTY